MVYPVYISKILLKQNYSKVTKNNNWYDKLFKVPRDQGCFKINYSKIITSFVISIFALLCWVSLATAQPRGIIISGSAVDQEDSDLLSRYIEQTQDLLLANGVLHKNIHIFFNSENKDYHPSTKATIVKVISGLAESTEKDDLTWVFLFGHANKNIRGINISTKGPRLTGQELSDLLALIKGKKIAICLNRQSSDFLNVLKNKDTLVITATDQSEQLNPPLFAGYFLDEWEKEEQGSLFSIVKRAAKKTVKYYSDKGLVRAENAQIFDGTLRSSYPFESLLTLPEGETGLSAVPLAPPPRKTSPIRPQMDLLADPATDKKRSDDTLANQDKAQKATKNTLNTMLSTQRYFRDYPSHQACYLRDYQSLLINKDGSSLHRIEQQVFLLKNVATESFSNLFLKDQALYSELDFEYARVIYPDGTFREVVAEKYHKKDSHQIFRIKFPRLKKGCLIEMKYSYNQSSGRGNIPYYNQELIIGKKYPVISSKLELKLPEDRPFFYKLYHRETEPSLSTTAFSRVIKYDFSKMDPIESLPYSLPYTERVPRLLLTNFASWDQFKSFIDSLLVGVSEIDKNTRTLVERITEDALTDTDKVSAIYRYLCDLHYETEPFGLRTLRPQTPIEVVENQFGDCKDKANALVQMAAHLGIEGYFVLLNRSLSTDETFPAWQFNHALVFFPKLNGYPDGLWLDPTDGSTPFGSLPPGDIGRTGMVFAGDKGYFFQPVKHGSTTINHTIQNFQITVNSNNTFHGTMQLEARGLADYFLRNRYKRSSIAEALHHCSDQLNKQIPMTAVNGLKIGDLQDLEKPFTLLAKIEGAHADFSLRHIMDPLPLWAYFSEKNRSYTTRINDGQPMRVTQVVQVESPVEPREAWSWERDNDTLYTSVTYKPQDSGWQRVLEINLKKADVEPSDYPTIRQQVQEWVNQMNQFFNNTHQQNRETIE